MTICNSVDIEKANYAQFHLKCQAARTLSSCQDGISSFWLIELKLRAYFEWFFDLNGYKILSTLVGIGFLTGSYLPVVVWAYLSAPKFSWEELSQFGSCSITARKINRRGIFGYSSFSCNFLAKHTQNERERESSFIKEGLAVGLVTRNIGDAFKVMNLVSFALLVLLQASMPRGTQIVEIYRNLGYAVFAPHFMSSSSIPSRGRGEGSGW